MEPNPSFIEQIALAPDLFQISKWIIAILGTALISAVGFTLHLIYGRVKTSEEDIKMITKSLEELKLELAKNYATNADVISAVQSIKLELHGTIKPLYDRVTQMDEYLRKGLPKTPVPRD